MTSIPTPSLIFNDADNDVPTLASGAKGRRGNMNLGVVATPRMALGEVSNFVRKSKILTIDATPKLRSNAQNKQSSSDSDDFEAVEAIREISRKDFRLEQIVISPPISSAGSTDEIELAGGSDIDDEEYDPIEHLHIPPQGFDECPFLLDETEKEMFAQMESVSDKVPMFVSAEVSLIPRHHSRDVKLDYEDMPDASTLTSDITKDNI